MIEKPPESTKVEIVYPIIRESKATGAWIMFFDRGRGICVKTNNSYWKLGEMHDTLVDHEDVLSWTKIEVKISG